MLSQGRERDELAELVTRAAGALWRVRVELALLAFPAMLYVLVDDVVGAFAGVVAVLVVVGLAASVPSVRRWLRDVLHGAQVRRRWRQACLDSGLPVSRAGRVERVLAGDRVSVRIAAGTTAAALGDRAETLSASLRVRGVQVARDPGDAARAIVTLVRRDPLADLAGAPWPYRGTERLSLWEPIPVGLDEDGETVSISLVERNLLLGGEPGAGKSAALSLVVATAALDPTAKLWLLDGKMVELAAWTPCAQRVARSDVADAIALLRQVRGEMEVRYRRLLADGRRKVSADDALPLHLVAVDELAFYLTVEDRKQRAEFADLLRDLVARGRAAGIIVVAATQKPGSEIVPTALRDLFGFRLALRCNTPQASDTILGQGWASLGYRASDIAGADRGVGYLLAEESTPVRLRSFYLDDDELGEIAGRATALRLQAAWTQTVAQAGDRQ